MSTTTDLTTGLGADLVAAPVAAQVAHTAGGPGWAADVVAETATPSPSDDPLRPELQPTDVSPGLSGFLAIFAVALAAIALFFSLSRQLRRMRHNAEAQGIGPDGPLDEDAATGEGAGPDDSAAPGGPGAAEGRPGAAEGGDGDPASGDGTARRDV